MSVRQFQNGPSFPKYTPASLLALVPVGLFGVVLLVYGLLSGFTELRFDLFGKETIGQIRATNEVGPLASLGGYEFVIDGKTYTGRQQKMFRHQPTIQYLSGDPAINRVKNGAMPILNWLFALLSIFGGGLISLVSFVQIYVFFRLRK